MARDDSKYRIYSLGTAAEDKVEGLDWELEVFPQEITQLADGPITNRGLMVETGGVDAAGNEYADSGVTSSTMNATWFGQGESNRRTCPNVFAGEELILYTYGETGKLWWTPRNTNSAGRRMETVTLAFAADPAGDDTTPRTADNSYQLDISGHRKVITLSNSMKNGEVNIFTFQLNGGDGFATLQDDVGNEITLNPAENRISIINAQDVEMHLNGTDLQVIVPGNEDHTVAGDETHTVSGNLNLTVSGNVNVQAAGGAIVKAPTIDLVGATKITGDTTIIGPLKVTGPTVLNGASSPAPITAPNIR